jgi:uncharacterized protein YacL
MDSSPLAEAPSLDAPPKALRESDYFLAWSLITLVGLVGGAIVGLIIAMLFIVGAKFVGAPIESVQLFAKLLIVVASLTFSYFTFRFFVRRMLAAGAKGAQLDTYVQREA